jgi:tripartite-type tricarboxylate transporter receptor subunit TctC
MTNRRQLLKATLGLPLSSVGLALAPHRLNAQEPWPTRTITVVVPFPPGGTADFAGRPLAVHLSEKLGQNVVVENKGGAGGGIGHAYVARAEPDGYTIMIACLRSPSFPKATACRASRPATRWTSSCRSRGCSPIR